MDGEEGPDYRGPWNARIRTDYPCHGKERFLSIGWTQLNSYFIWKSIQNGSHIINVNMHVIKIKFNISL